MWTAPVAIHRRPHHAPLGLTGVPTSAPGRGYLDAVDQGRQTFVHNPHYYYPHTSFLTPHIDPPRRSLALRELAGRTRPERTTT
ncbi:MAG: hypothetical protein ACRDWE_07430 [Acidimicrobiales bacterium]